jgi:Trk K+ transport system NAD-binding subunit
VEPDTLRAAGASRANWLVALTGDDFVNSQIVSAVHALGTLRDGLHVLVQVEDPSLARFLEEEEPPSAAGAHGVAAAGAAAPVVTMFSADAIATEALLAMLRRKTRDGGDDLLLERRRRSALTVHPRT